MIFKNRSTAIYLMVALTALTIGQGISYVLAPGSWQAFLERLPSILSMIAFWGPIIAIISAFCVWVMMRLMGFRSLEEIRRESVDQNNPTPAIIFIGTLIASLLFLSVVIRP